MLLLHRALSFLIRNERPTRRNDSNSSSRSRSGSRASTNRDRIRCSMCREYGHFAKDCLASKLEKETEQMQQMINIDEVPTDHLNL